MTRGIGQGELEMEAVQLNLPRIELRKWKERKTYNKILPINFSSNHNTSNEATPFEYNLACNTKQFKIIVINQCYLFKETYWYALHEGNYLPNLLPLLLLNPHTQYISFFSRITLPKWNCGSLVSWKTTTCSCIALVQHVAYRHLEQHR